jgi:hypothetical protein
MNVTRLMWTRLRCSKSRRELETLQTKLTKVGIPSEIRCNSVAAKRGIFPLEIFVVERDLFRASKVCQGPETAVSADDAAGSPGSGSTINGAEPEGEFAQATALLEKQVEELPVVESKLIDRCSALQET